MLSLYAIIEKFGENGDKTGWHYVTLPAETAQILHPENRKAFRVKGFIDAVEITQLTALPKADGDYLIALKGELRRKLRKGEGAAITLRLEKDKTVFEVPVLLTEALETDADALRKWNSIPPSHQRHYVNHIFSAKTEETQLRRIARSVAALAQEWSFGEMIRAGKAEQKTV